MIQESVVKGMDNKKVIYRLEHVSKVFQDRSTETIAVDDVSLEIYEGEIFGMIGMSGAGKSTLVRTLNRLESVTQGEIWFDGRNLGELQDRELRQIRKEIAMIFQGFHLLLQKSVLDNVELPLRLAKMPRRERRERGMEMLRLVGLEEKAAAYPAQLSGGQKQRVAIARALAMNPKVLLCDEATSALDPRMTEDVLGVLQRINRELGITVVIITHEMNVIEKICERVAIIDRGRLAEIGSVREIFANPRSEAAKKLILPALSGENPFDMTDRKCYRLVFDGRSATEPIIANLVRQTGKAVNILSANTRSVGGVGYGQMIVEFPKKESEHAEILAYFRSIGMEPMEIRQEEQVQKGGEDGCRLPLH